MKLVKRLIVLITAFCAIAAIEINAGTTGTICGKVCDKATGEPIPGASVIIKGTSMGCAAAFDGTFTIININPGVYSLIAQTIGYDKLTIDSVVVKADSITIIDFVLESSISRLTTSLLPPKEN